MKAKFLVPLALFVVLVLFLAVGLRLDPREVPSPLVNKPAPAFKLAQLEQPELQFSPEDLKGKVWVFNVWASWCVACRQEHPVLMDFARAQIAPLIGLDYKDQRKDALGVLKRSGNPYDLTAFDADGRVGIDYGVYGVPESYVIDKAGVIRYKHIGPITSEALQKTIIPLINELKKIVKILYVWILVFLTSGGVWAKEAMPLADDPAVEQRLIVISEELRCLVCQNESLAGSRSDLAMDLRRELRGLIKQGKTDEQIKEFMVSRYGDFVLYRPPVKPSTWLLWAGPFGLMVVGIASLFVYLRRRNTDIGTGGLTDDERKRADALLQEGEK